MINPSLKCNNLFREQVEKCLSIPFNKNTMESIRDCLRKNNICVMAPIMFYENNVKIKNIVESKGVQPKNKDGFVF